ncbi:MAG: hypothetical protein AAGA06_08050 [Pseudomonadota bacterium]
MSGDTFTLTAEEELLIDISTELRRAREKFPRSRLTMVALTEEVGELSKALMDEPLANVRAEAIQVAVMAMRIVLDGDRSIDQIRRDHNLDPLAGETDPIREIRSTITTLEMAMGAPARSHDLGYWIDKLKSLAGRAQ